MSPDCTASGSSGGSRMERDQPGRDIRSCLTKINERIHTGAIRDCRITPACTKARINRISASEVDLLTMALFCITATEWQETNPDKTGTIRDYAGIPQLLCFSNPETLNARFISDILMQPESRKAQCDRDPPDDPAHPRCRSRDDEVSDGNAGIHALAVLGTKLNFLWNPGEPGNRGAIPGCGEQGSPTGRPEKGGDQPAS